MALPDDHFGDAGLPPTLTDVLMVMVEGGRRFIDGNIAQWQDSAYCPEIPPETRRQHQERWRYTGRLMSNWAKLLLDDVRAVDAKVEEKG